MAFLATDLRKQLENAVKAARRESETGAANVLASVGYAERESPAGLSELLKALRKNLRARGKQLGEGLRTEGDNRTAYEIGRRPLVEEIAYEQWHRMLFARFLADNELLRHPSGAPVTLSDCEELYADEGALDAWDLAARYASAMLPGLFRESAGAAISPTNGKVDGTARIRLAPETRAKLEGLIDRLPVDVFTSEDGLGWVYQFWQSERKKQVNDEAKSKGTKIGAAELPAVTQLFTEEYMVRFLLENTLGAWWAGKYPHSPLLADMRYLRYAEDTTSTPLHLASADVYGEGLGRGRTPAAGTFDGWAKTAARLRVLDPCCGSGHFLTVAFDMLRRMRMEEEGLSAAAAADAVLRDNLFGLELDRRCTQIAMFNVALAAWRVGGHPEMHVPQIACSGTPVRGQLHEWQQVAREDEELERYVGKLYEAFADAPILGSLVDPNSLLVETGLQHRRTLILPGLKRPQIATHTQSSFSRRSARQSRTVLEQIAKRFGADPELAIFANSAEEVARAADILSSRYDLTVTNVPYLSRSSQGGGLRDYTERRHSAAKADLATVMLDRCFGFGEPGGTVAAVTPQNWLFLGAYRKLREDLLVSRTLDVVARLGTGAFETVSGEVVNVALVTLTTRGPLPDATFMGIDASEGKAPADKDDLLRQGALVSVSQAAQEHNPENIISLQRRRFGVPISSLASVHYGSKPGQTSRVTRSFWEVPSIIENHWMKLESSPNGLQTVSGKSEICLSLGEIASQQIVEFGIRGSAAWHKRGVILSKMNTLPAAPYMGEFFDDNTYVLIPNDERLRPTLWEVARTGHLGDRVRHMNQKMAVDVGSVENASIDLEHWKKVADEKYPNGLPEPHSDDPTQWLFKGQPKGSDAPLQVVDARLLGYRWPEQLEGEVIDPIDALTDPDGIVCLPAVSGEQPAARRLLDLLRAAWGNEWSNDVLDGLLARVATKRGTKDLVGWLMDDFFDQHCRLFQNRPFIWHIWDGRKDGFSALVDYHRLDTARLSKLTYTYLNEWISRQRTDAERYLAGAQDRLDAALALQAKLELIIDGSPPYDIYVRWKPLAQQPIGWQPDLNDGVRLNVRPFIRAGVLRGKFSVNWNNDRGANPAGADVYAWSEAAQRAAVGETKPESPDGALRLNDLHLPLAVKRAAREAARSEAPAIVTPRRADR